MIPAPRSSRIIALTRYALALISFAQLTGIIASIALGASPDAIATITREALLALSTVAALGIGGRAGVDAITRGLTSSSGDRTERVELARAGQFVDATQVDPPKG